MFPIFFSVSNSDVAFAEETWAEFPDDWIYLFSKTGRFGARMWAEIAVEELPRARIFVVFWSRNYPASAGCVKEIIQASALYRSGMLKPVILRLDDHPIHWKDGMDAAAKPVFDALKPLLDYRAPAPGTSVEQAKALIAQEAEPLLQSDHPRMPRHDIHRALRTSLQRGRFTLSPACWVSGFNGVGRETLVRELYRDFAPNSRGIVVEINESTLPRQLLLRIESEAFGTGLDRLQQINNEIEEDATDAVAHAIERVFASGEFLILRHGRIVQEEVELPEWLDDVVRLLQAGTRPKLFIISQLPLAGDRLIRNREFMSSFRIPTVDEDQLTEFCYQLIGHFDPNPTRWQDEDVGRIVRVAGGTVGFLVSLVRSAARIENFDHVDAMLAHEDARMGEAITTYVRWAFGQLRDHPDGQKALLFLNDISPCHIVDLERAIEPQVSMMRVLGRLVDLGLVERETDDLYRLTPLLARRLSRDLLRPELLKWMEEAQRKFASRPFEAAANSSEDGHEFVRLEARIQAALLSGTDNLPNSLGAFVSASHWFQAGIRLYHARKWKPAYRLLKKAYEFRQQFRDSSRMEIDRYFCLSATRMREYAEAEACIQRLNADQRAKPIAAFLQADLHEYRRAFPDAIREYERALSLNKGKDRRIEYIYRPLIRCILASGSPDFAKAEKRAKAYVQLRRTVFSLSALARVYLQWKYRGPASARDVPANIDRLYRDALDDLANDPGAGAAPFELYAEEAEYTGDFQTALQHMDQAIQMDPERFQLRAERWRMMAKTGEPTIAAQAVRELDQARLNPAYAAVWPSYVHALTDTYARALIASGLSLNLANGFAPELQQGGELGGIVTRVRREGASGA